MKRKNDTEDVVLAHSDAAKTSKKRRRLSNEEEGKKSKSKDKKSKKPKTKAQVDAADLPNSNPADDNEVNSGAQVEPMEVDTEQKSSKKDKKEKKDKKKKKSKDQEEEAADDQAGDAADVNTKKSKKEKKEKKAKKSKDLKEAEETATTEPADTDITASESTKDKKSKKDKKDKKQKSQEAQQEEAEPASTNGTTGSDKKNRFIAFVGNLPFSATVEQIKVHFAAVSPIDVRLLHKRDQNGVQKPRGAAFVEFGRYDHMKTALEKMHHSLFEERDDRGKVKKGAGRQINVELTAGGGGNKTNRMDKIKAKNQKLNEERARRAQETEKIKAKKEKKDGKETVDEQAGIHPSRRFQVPTN